MGRQLRGWAVFAVLLLSGCAGSGNVVAPEHASLISPPIGQLKALLDAELARLGVDPARQASEAPSGTDSAVFDLTIDSVSSEWPRVYSFSFTEQAAGDYDLNGLVGVSDLTPLGVHFGSSVNYIDPVLAKGITWWPSGDPAGVSAINWRRARVDGNHDGLITVSDITPIAQHWQERYHGYRVYITAPEGSPEMLPNPLDEHASVTLDRPAIDQQEPVRYTFSYTAQTEGEYQAFVVAYDTTSATESAVSNVLNFMVPEEGGNILPAVELFADPVVGDAPLQVTFSATAQDLDGQIELYEWDFNGDSVFEEASGTTPTNDFTYTLVASYSPVVRVTDNDGGTTTDTVLIQVDEPGDNEPPQASFCASTLSGPLPLSVVFDATSSADPDGGIALYEWDFDGDGIYDISSADDPTAQHTYSAAEAYEVKLSVQDNRGASDSCKSIITAGTSWYVRESTALGGTHPGLAEVAGKPAVVYVVPHIGYDSSGPLYLALARNNLGLEWDEPIEVAANAMRCAVAEVEGQPAVVYLVKHSQLDYNLCYRRATDIANGAWGDEIVIDPWAQDFFYLEFMVVAGHPAALYAGFETLLEDKPRAVKYARASDPLGASWSEPLTIYVVGDEALGGLDLEIVNDKPAMLLKLHKNNTMDPDHRGVYYQASDAAGGSWLTVPSFFTFMGTNALCVADGRPALVHQTVNEDMLFYLEYRRADDADGTEWSTVADIVTDGLDEVPFCPRLIADANRVYCCYVDWGASRYGQMAVHSLDSAGTTWSAGEVLDPGRPDTFFGSSMAIVGGRAMLAYAVVVGGESRVRLAVFAD